MPEGTTPLLSFVSDLQLFVEALKTASPKDKQVQREIDDLVYTSTKLPASVGLEVLVKLGNIVAPVFDSTDSSVSQAYTQALLKFLEKLAEEGVSPLLKTILTRTQCNKLATTGAGGYVKDDFDEHFSGEYVHLLKVVIFVLWHNLLGFSRGAR